MELISNLKNSILNLENKSAKIYFFTQDTKGNPKASIHYIYELAMTLKQNGFNSIILHEKPDYTPVSSWLDSKYSDELPHQHIEGANLSIFPEDYLIVPEIFAYIMPQLTNLNCTKIVLCQSYDYIFETLQPGQSWSDFGFKKCITTCESQKNYISSIMRNISVDVIEPLIGIDFSPTKTTQKPVIAVHTREQRDAVNMIKNFYTKYPQYRWVAFKDLRGIPYEEFSISLKECMLSVWVDLNSGFGTFPLESMSCNVPVMGKIPNLVPNWLNENNGIWITDVVKLPDFIAEYIQNWMEDNISEKLYEEGMNTSQKFKNKESFESNLTSTFSHYFDLKISTYKEELNKLELQEN